MKVSRAEEKARKENFMKKMRKWKFMFKIVLFYWYIIEKLKQKNSNQNKTRKVSEKSRSLKARIDSERQKWGHHVD